MNGQTYFDRIVLAVHKDRIAGLCKVVVVDNGRACGSSKEGANIRVCIGIVVMILNFCGLRVLELVEAADVDVLNTDEDTKFRSPTGVVLNVTFNLAQSEKEQVVGFVQSSYVNLSNKLVVGGTAGRNSTQKLQSVDSLHDDATDRCLVPSLVHAGGISCSVKEPKNFRARKSSWVYFPTLSRLSFNGLRQTFIGNDTFDVVQ